MGSMGIKPDSPKAYLTPSPGAYVPEKSEKYLQEKISHSLGIKLASPKPFSTPAPSAYRQEDCKEEKAAIAFGIKHSPYVGSLKGDSYVRARTETVKTPVQTQEDFRPRSGTFTKTGNSEGNHKDRAADDHQDNQDDDPAVPTSGLGRGSSICTITITIPIFVITYPNLTKMKRHVWYWCSRVPVSFPNQVFEKSTPLTTLCDTDRSALIKSNSVSDVE